MRVCGRRNAPPMRSKCEVQYTYNALIIESSEVAADMDVE